MNEVFFSLTNLDVHDIARTLGVYRDLTDDELRSIRKMFEFGSDWAEVLEIAIKEVMQ